MAGVDVVVDVACGLQEGVADGCAEEFESAAFHIAAYRIRNARRYSTKADVGQVVYYSVAIGEE